MDDSQTTMIDDELDAQQAPGRGPTATAVERYRRPRIVAIGTVTALVEQNSTGRQSDGPGGYYVWGS